MNHQPNSERTKAVGCITTGCGALPGEPCQSMGRPIEGFHPSRHEAAGTAP